MKVEDLTTISIMATIKRFTRHLLRGKKKVEFEGEFKEGCNEIL
jgi:hypothetical protein